MFRAYLTVNLCEATPVSVWTVADEFVQRVAHVEVQTRRGMSVGWCGGTQEEYVSIATDLV